MEKILNDYFGFQLLECQKEQMNELFGFGKKKSPEVSAETKRKVDDIYKKIEDFYKIKVSNSIEQLDRYQEFPTVLFNIAIDVNNIDASQFNEMEMFQMYSDFKNQLKRDINVDVDKEFSNRNMHWLDQVDKKNIKAALPMLRSFAKKVFKK